jgi:hypothetical protein
MPSWNVSVLGQIRKNIRVFINFHTPVNAITSPMRQPPISWVLLKMMLTAPSS